MSTEQGPDSHKFHLSPPGPRTLEEFFRFPLTACQHVLGIAPRVKNLFLHNLSMVKAAQLKGSPLFHLRELYAGMLTFSQTHAHIHKAAVQMDLMPDECESRS